MSFGRTYKPKDPNLDLELGKLHAKFEGHIQTVNLDLPDVCEGIGRNIKDGQLSALERVIDGSTVITGLTFKALSEEPTNLVVGLVVLADRTNWDPLAKGSAGPYFTWYNGSAWKAIDSQ